jgi:hypothetical protein
MPQAVVLIAQAVTSAAIAFGAASAGALLAASYVGLAIGYAAVGFALNKAMSFLSPRPKSGAGRGLEVAMTDSAAEGFILYGRVRVSGVNVIPPLSSGNEGRYLHQLVALAIHEVDGYEDTYFNQDTIANAAIGSITGASTDGAVSSTAFAGSAWIRRYRGTSTQTADFILTNAFPSAFTSNFRGRGIAYAAIQYDWGRGRVYTGGVPLTTFLVRGKRCYDPRLDTSPGANPTNASYAAWTENPALCWADYMLSSYGYALPASRIDWSSVVAAANECDELVNIPGATTQKRYTLNGRLSTASDPEANMRAIVDAMLGKVSDSGGVYRIFAGAWRAPQFVIAKEDWLQVNAIQTTAPRNESRFNGVVCYIVNPARNWQRVEAFRRFSNTFQSSDGGERIWIETEQSLCTNDYEGQRKAEFILRQSRNGIVLSGTLPPRFMKIRMWDNVTLDFDELGWVSKTFTVSGFRLAPTGSVEVVLTEEQEGDWADLTAGEYNAPSAATLPTTNPTVPSAPQNFTVTPQFGNLLIQFDEPVVRPAATNYRLIRAVQSLATPTNTVVWEGTSRRFLHESDPRSPYYWFIQASAGSYDSVYTPNTFGLRAQPLIRPENTQGAKLLPDGELGIGTGSYWIAQLFSNQGTPTQDYPSGVVSYSPVDGFTANRGRIIVVASGDWELNIFPFNFGRIADPQIGSYYFHCTPNRTLNGMMRWRRMSSVESSLKTQLTVYSERAWNPTSKGAPAVNFSVSTNAVFVNCGEWQTLTVSAAITNSQQNYCYIGATVLPDLFQVTSGVIEIGEIQLYLL